MNVLVLLSAMNANIYGSSRIAYSLVQRGQGPKALGRVSAGSARRGARRVFGFVCVLLSGTRRPDHVFPWLLNMIGAVILVVWIFIAVSQLLLRRRVQARGTGEAGRADVAVPCGSTGWRWPAWPRSSS